MVLIKKNVSLKPFNTFGIDLRASYFARAESIREITELLEKHRQYFPFYIIGGGSNILFTKDYNGLILQPSLKGISIRENDKEHCMVEVGAGENWDDFVKWAVENNLGGVENLSHIPGSTGSSPIQNIGAYGAEVKDVIKQVNFIDLETLQITALNNSECNFGYRNSIFKNQLKNRIIITSVIFKLCHHPVFKTGYGNLQEELDKSGKASLKTIRNAVISIRKAKLPDPEITGNAGSFFKNPVVNSISASNLKDQYNNMPMFPVSTELTKIPAGWLIEQCGWKGKRFGNAGVHDKQALVIINCGNASGEEIKNLAMKIKESVFSKFGIELEAEVNIL